MIGRKKGVMETILFPNDLGSSSEMYLDNFFSHHSVFLPFLYVLAFSVLAYRGLCIFFLFLKKKINFLMFPYSLCKFRKCFAIKEIALIKKIRTLLLLSIFLALCECA